MFNQFYELVNSTGPVTLKFYPGKEGTMKVVVTPSADKGADAALTQPLILTATPAELNAGFADALRSFDTARTSLTSQVAATIAILESAKKIQSDKAVKSLKGKTVEKPNATASSIAGDDDDDNGGDDDAGASSQQSSIEASSPATASSGTDLASLI